MPRLKYAKDTQRAAAEHITDISYFESRDSMILDPVTLRNLEIVEARGETAGRTLFHILNNSITSMGSRLLKSWLVRPSIKRSEIQTRLAAVTELRRHDASREDSFSLEEGRGSRTA